MTINFNFSNMYNYLEQLRQNPDEAILRRLKDEFNSLFPDNTCKNVLFTNNTDNVLFGAYVMPNIKSDKIFNIIIDEAYERINEYTIEIDSKLFNILDNNEIIAILVHDVSSLINSISPLEIAVKEIDVYLDKQHMALKPSNDYNYYEILMFGFKDLLHKITSIFCKEDYNDDIVYNDFIAYCGLTDELTTAYSKIKESDYSAFIEDNSTSTVIAWVLNLYNDVLKFRIQVIRHLRKSMYYTACRLVKNELNHLIKVLSRIDDYSLLEGSFFKDVANKFNRSFYRSLRDYEGDFYDYSVRLRATMDEDDALMLLHQINSKITILDSMLDLEDITDEETDKIIKLREKFYTLRDKLAATKVYRNNYRRIYINYPD